MEPGPALSNYLQQERPSQLNHTVTFGHTPKDFTDPPIAETVEFVTDVEVE